MLDDGSDVLLGASELIEPGNPLYDEEDGDDNYVLVSGDFDAGSEEAHKAFDPDYRRIVIGPRLALAEFKRQVVSAMQEYFSSEDAEEAVRIILELACPEYHYEVVKRAVSLSLDHKERERELVSKFLSAAFPTLLNADHVRKGFERLLEVVDELEIDVPAASNLLASFLARAIVDEILPPSFLMDPYIAGVGGEVVSQAKRVLSREHQYSRLQRVWGPGDGRAVPELKVEMDNLLLEYLVSGDMVEAERCVKELQVPHFHHELVKRAIVTVLDKSDEEQQSMVRLIVQLCESEVISTHQRTGGFQKIESLLDDLSLDAPEAHKVFEFVRSQVESKLQSTGQ
uniref:MI domain-containing protein n=2 Tax=Rhizochromulina marina TaxID=1034831 RepID=A0A7S2R8H0_9STRA|mmetsp:Transcript_12615/g.36547  ORF Transcript_12615/g.36547 Transcript_12615/m.36547 type:complete len:342 (+) Transcript_12615:458-1483(+)